ncbi:MAG: 4Fe-4S binding protein [Oscillospiraceae bacterium]|nr:4Fe-4S binding protein [Oscillospiraceae bacterium]
MSEIIIVKPEKCVGCNACIRACPVPEANIAKQVAEGKFITSVMEDKCICCGSCVSACAHGARDYIDDTEACMSQVGNEKMVILATPSIKAILPNKWKGVLDWFKKKGCIIFDVSLGADICTWAHLRAIEAKQVGNVISQPCPAIVKYIENYQPKLLQNLSPIHSPILCTVTYIKKYLRRTNPIAVISPCIAKKMEFADTGVQFNVTIKKLMEYFEKNDISIPTHDPNDFSYEFDDQQGQLGGIYPRPGGLRDTLLAHDPEMNIATAEGVHSVYAQLDMYAKMPDTKHPQVYDVLSCEFGCNMGPGSGTKQNVFDVMTTMKGVLNEATERRKGGGLFNRGEDKLFKHFDDELQLADFIRSYRPGRPTPPPNEQQLEPIYESMGKHTDEDKKYDCHACGYKSCRDMAIAIYRGLNTPNNCIVHAKSVLLAKHSELANKHEKLAAITEECLQLSDKLKHDIGEIGSNMTSIGESTAKTHERANVVNDLLKNVVTFCNGNPTMDENSVKQLITILETTIKAFGAVDENVNVTNESSESIKKSIEEITTVIGKLNDVLLESEKQELQ